ncbi:MAG: hypothetical protein CVV23_06885 [Ignavibacteriae bacterium HGW-Ignavibacteriae-2]|jgi:DNA mismatch repair ATPase MutL|nr:MAG: hypothetical protein CVV23_06885 [Ignavibacteriae bacterium HGW-Ignavibacteriae-2]
MDNIVEYLVILFFIVSALSSFFKKKPTSNTEQNDGEKQKSKKSIDLGKILFPDEIYGTDKPEQDKSARYKYDSGDPSKSADPFDESADVYNEHAQYKPQKLSEVDSYFEEAIKRSAQSAQTKSYTRRIKTSRESRNDDEEPKTIGSLESKYTIKRRNDIKLKLKNTNELRDLIIINEILNKPIALRKR